MNERIEGLWWKARIGYNNQSCDPEVLAKFAELIVRECASIADIEKSNLIGCGYITKTKGMLIKEHFGVEE
jgi:hypothetical protein